MGGWLSQSWLVFFTYSFSWFVLPRIFTSSYILFFLVQLIQAGMCLGEILTDTGSQLDDLASAQARARDFKGQAVQLKKELEKSHQDQEKSRRDQEKAQEELAVATRRVAGLEEELKAADVDRRRVTELEGELESLRANHQQELDAAKKKVVHDYVAGYRYRFRADFA